MSSPDIFAFDVFYLDEWERSLVEGFIFTPTQLLNSKKKEKKKEREKKEKKLVSVRMPHVHILRNLCIYGLHFVDVVIYDAKYFIDW